MTESGNFTNSGTALIAGPQTWSTGTFFTNTAGHATFDTDAGSASASPLSLIATGGTITLNSNQHIASLLISGSGTIDLLGNEMFIASATQSAVRSDIAAAYDKGRWDAPGMTSSLAESNPNGTTVLGYTANGAGVIVKYTWYGDANLDGIVNAADLAMITSSGSTWTTGDFNYDGKVNADDWSLFMLGDAASSGTNISATLPEPPLSAY